MCGSCGFLFYVTVIFCSFLTHQTTAQTSGPLPTREVFRFQNVSVLWKNGKDAFDFSEGVLTNSVAVCRF